MGEFWSLTREERLDVIDAVTEEANGQWPIGAHVIHMSASEMLSRAAHTEGSGYDLLIVARPLWSPKPKFKGSTILFRADVQRGFGCRAFNAMVRFVMFCSIRITEA